MHARPRFPRAVRTALLSGLLVLPLACMEGDGGVQAAETANVESGARPAERPFGTPEDLDRAAALWERMASYREWPSYPGKEGWRDGTSPHGKFLRYRVNETAAGSPEDPPDGSIVVKENYPRKDEASLSSVTVMEKVAGYDPEHADWFWVKFAPDGEVLQDAREIPLAGRIAGGRDAGCIGCHTGARGDDYLFAND